MSERKDRRAIFIRCEPAFLADVERAAADPPFAGNVAQFSREAIRDVVALRRALGPRYGVVIADLLATTESEAA
jgi:hypothetical protein